MSDKISITDLIIYPVKGCRGIHVPVAKVTPLGLASASGLLKDRSFVIVRADKEKPPLKFVTQRQKAELALVGTRVEPPEALMEGGERFAEEARLVLSAPGMMELSIPLSQKKEENKPVLEVNVWAWTGLGLDEGTEAAEWFSTYLRTPAKLVRHAGDTTDSSTSFHRAANMDYAPDGVEIAFADQFPYLLANEASLADLNKHIGDAAAVPMNRFRPNIIVAGQGAWDEDMWEDVRLGDDYGALMRNVKPCSRCNVPNIDQATAACGDEPTRTMMSVRSGQVLGWMEPAFFKNTVFFGSSLCCVEGAGSLLRTGTDLKVMSRLTGPIKPREKSN